MKNLKILTITLIIVLITMVSFGGVYKQYQNRMENTVKDYLYAMDLKGARVIRLRLNTEGSTTIKDSEGNVVEGQEDLTDDQIAEKGYVKEENFVNSQEVKNLENYKKSKEIIEKRLKELNVQDYIIKLDEETGEFVIELPENDQTDSIVTNVATTGKFEIVDSQTNEVLMNNNDIETAKVLYGSNSTTTNYNGTTVYLSIEFTKEGTKKLEEISNKYVKVENKLDSNDENNEEANEENDNEENSEETEKKITMKVDDQEIMSTSFDETLKTGKLQLSIGSATTEHEMLKQYIEQASSMATVLKTGKIPLVYELQENKYLVSDITNSDLNNILFSIIGITVVALIVLIIKYKLLGELSVISYIGLPSTLLLLIRYANVPLSIEGIFGIVIILILNYILINKLLSNLKNKGQFLELQEIKKYNKEIYKEFFIKIIPIIIMVITFSFVRWIPISSFGMVMFWGILLIAIYNIIITNKLLETGAVNIKK